MAEKYNRIKRELVHKGQIIEIYKDYVEIPNGTVAQWDFIGHKGAAAVIPITKEGKILMVKQYRNAIDRFTIEIPAGGLNSIEEAMYDCASRELEEETGFKSSNLEFLISLRTTVAFCNERIDVFVARDLIKTCQNLDEDEFVDVEAFELEELYDMIFEGKIQDAKTVSALFAYKAKYC
ncbi:ADP-ribose pyrophosphatase [Lachnotalea glycerini]|uniref:ADP-ribose pyrophosphatase n=1 Tax=Lachnotalea glycerini TaxID=1763509 RepID=A0A255ILF5_9FIRM|nr:NUDIX hydrolase [Lachnotalea glycerini]PXV95998.1 ADP-ribose pyrophosphatase [Lachnotalea glycerini]RDY32957.1 NUDIX hydrolase [Lachnotalea glycerini]